MPLNLFVLLAIISIIVTPLAVLLIPRARRSTGFDLLLWAATPLVSFLGGWYAFGSFSSANPPVGPAVSGIPLLPLIAGALVGALVVNLPLWILDRFEHPSFDDEFEWDEEEPPDEEPGGDGSGEAESKADLAPEAEKGEQK